eukprot:gene4012-4263_t
MSFNIRMDTEQDGDNRWDCRKECVAEVIRKQKPLVLGVQEPHKHQVEWLSEALQEYTCLKGKGRSAVVFGIGSELDVTDEGTWWLSNQCRIPYTKFEGSAFPRILHYARFTFKADGRSFTFICTHFDHEGEGPRTQSSQLIVDKLAELSAGGPVILVGDLNAEQSGVLLSSLWALWDFIFVGNGVKVNSFGVVPDKQPNGCCVSDHKPITAEVELTA